MQQTTQFERLSLCQSSIVDDPATHCFDSAWTMGVSKRFVWYIIVFELYVLYCFQLFKLNVCVCFQFHSLNGFDCVCLMDFHPTSQSPTLNVVVCFVEWFDVVFLSHCSSTISMHDR